MIELPPVYELIGFPNSANIAWNDAVLACKKNLEEQGHSVKELIFFGSKECKAVDED